MSGEHFETKFMKEVSAEGTVFNQKYGMQTLNVYCYAHSVIEECANAVRNDPMTGTDLPEKREFVAGLLDECSELVRHLAYDSAGDSYFDEDYWNSVVDKIAKKLYKHVPE